MRVTTRVSDPLVGRLLDGRYRVDERVARGGMATVYVGLDTRLDRPVAIKVMHVQYAEDADFVARFGREARSAARLNHPCVVSVYDQGEDAGFVFLVMEYVPGRTLRDLLNERGRLSAAEALELMEPVLAALVRGARSGHRPPRRQAGERPARRRRTGQGRRLRSGAGVLRGRQARRRRRRASSSARWRTSRRSRSSTGRPTRAPTSMPSA